VATPGVPGISIPANAPFDDKTAPTIQHRLLHFFLTKQKLPKMTSTTILTQFEGKLPPPETLQSPAAHKSHIRRRKRASEWKIGHLLFCHKEDSGGNCIDNDFDLVLGKWPLVEFPEFLFQQMRHSATGMSRRANARHLTIFSVEKKVVEGDPDNDLS
jgi:hypothetical protein